MPPLPRHVLIVTDAWHPQLNGVVRSIEGVVREMERRGIAVSLLTPNEFDTVPMPGYGEIRLSRTRMQPVFERIEAIAPDAIHIATEGPLGIIARRWCRKHGFPFSSAYHTEFPEFLRARLPVPLALSYRLLRWFHGAARSCLVSTPYLMTQLKQRGFGNLAIWRKGVDTELFHPRKRDALPYLRPVFLYVGRLAVEKNIEAFLQLDLPGTKLVIGGGPILDGLKADFPNAVFLGPQEGEALARYYASADVFVFPSRTDTFGLVLLEALASGTPVAGFPAAGPIDVIGDAAVGVLDEDLRNAALAALAIPRNSCRARAEEFSWEASTDQFLANLPVASVLFDSATPAV